MKGFLKDFIQNRPFADEIICHFLRRRMRLPKLSLGMLFDDFDQVPVTITNVPRGRWSTPLADLIILMKLVACSHPKRILEIGSFRGYTALLFAQHSDPDTEIVTIDSYPDHGEAYRGTPFATKIERRVGEIGSAILHGDDPQSYDLIFVDDGHLYEDVKRDTELALPLISPGGYLVWHDYANWGYFSGQNGVPDYLGNLSDSGLPIAQIAGTQLAIHSADWSANDQARARLEKAMRASTADAPWESADLRC